MTPDEARSAELAILEFHEQGVPHPLGWTPADLPRLREKWARESESSDPQEGSC